MTNELLGQGMQEEMEYQPEETPEETPAETPTGTEPAGEPDPEGTEPPSGDDESTDIAAAEPGPGEVDKEPMTTEQMLDQMRKMNDQINSLQRRLGKQRRGHQAVPFVAPETLDETTAPKVESFSTIEEFNTAYDNWKIDQRVAAGIRKATAGTDETVKTMRADFVQDVFADGGTAYPDFKEVVGKETLPITNEMIDAIHTELDSEIVNPEDVFYYLGKNPAEAAALSRMNKSGIVRAIAKIEARLEIAKAGGKPTPQTAPKAKPKKTVTEATPPIKPTDSTVVITKDPNKMTQAEYEAWRKAGGGR